MKEMRNERKKNEEKKRKKNEEKKNKNKMFRFILFVFLSSIAAFHNSFSLEVLKTEKATLDISPRVQILGLIRSYDDGGIMKGTGGFLIKRARLYFSGEFLGVRFENQFTAEGREVSLRDFSLRYYFDKLFGVRMGLMKVQSNREEINSSSELILSDRSILNSYVSFGRDVGFGVIGYGDKFSYGIYAFTGSGKGAKELPKQNNLLWNARIMVSPIGKIEKIKQGAFDKKTYLNIGLSLLYEKISDDFQDKVVGRPDKTEILKRLTNEKITIGGEYFSVSPDLRFQYEEVEFEVEGLLSGYGPRARRITSKGFRIQPGFVFRFWKISALGISGRYSFVDFEDGSGCESSLFFICNSTNYKSQIHEISLGPTFYFDKHKLKFHIDYNLRIGKNVLPNSNKPLHEIRALFQVKI